MLAGMKILMVDDDTYGMRPTIDALEARKAFVEIAKTGTDAIDILNEKKFDLIILDIMMSPGPKITTDDQGRSTGIVVYKKLRAGKYPVIPIIVSTVTSDPKLLDNFEGDPMCVIVNKPYTFHDLRNAIEPFFVHRK